VIVAYSRPFWPLFLHVLGAMTLVGAVLAAAIVSWAAWRRPATPVLARAACWSLVSVGLPGYVVMRVFGEIIRSDEGFKGNFPTWLMLGRNIADGGALLLVATAAAAYWWLRTGKIRAARTVSLLSTVYLVLLAVAWLAMSGKWG
jgi:cytochrome bd-type quinol oxidase subunit 1